MRTEAVEPEAHVAACVAPQAACVAPEEAAPNDDAIPATAASAADAKLQRALYEKQRPGAASVLDARQKQRVIAMVCSNPPDGFARWTVRLVAEEAVKQKLVPGAGRETIRLLLSHHDLRPWREKNVVVRRNLTMNT